MDNNPKNVSVLVIDPEEVTRNFFANNLAGGRFLFRFAKTAMEGEIFILREKPDLVVVENTLPDGSGMDMAARMSTLSPFSTTVLMTSTPSQDFVISGIKLGVACYITKPLSTPHEVETKFNLALTRHLQQKALKKRILEMQEATAKLRSRFPDMECGSKGDGQYEGTQVRDE
jgi:two-component system, response regulator YesN